MGIMSKVVLAAIFIFMAMLECSGVQLKIISFNIEHFARRDKFYRNYRSRRVSPLAESLVQILKEYDIIFIQEIKGATNMEAVTDLRDLLNEPPAKRRRRGRDSGGSDNRYYEVVWPGCFFDTTGNSETYAYYINTEKIKKWDAHLYPSRKFDQGRSRRGSICRDYMGPVRNRYSDKYFVRPPYSLCVRDNADSKCLFFLLGLHAKPLAKPDGSRRHLQTTKQELDNLKTAYDYFSNLYGTNHAILMGDLNADGTYLTYAQFRYLELTKSAPGSWISYPIVEKQHTNVNGDTMVHPAMYDRFFGTANMLECLKEAEVVDEPVITRISDHYPIAITIDCAKFDLDGGGGAA